MRKTMATLALLALAAPAFAADDPVAIAANSGVCGDAGVKSARWREDGSVGAVCNAKASTKRKTSLQNTPPPPAPTFLPIALGGVGLAAVAAAVGGSSSTSDTQ